jgi:hypothetical protein
MFVPESNNPYENNLSDLRKKHTGNFSPLSSHKSVFIATKGPGSNPNPNRT